MCRARGLDVAHGDALTLSARPARRIARRTVRGAGRRAPAAGLSARVSQRSAARAAPGRADRARDDQRRLLVRVLPELHPRHHARAAAPSRNAAVSGRRRAASPSAEVQFRVPVPQADRLPAIARDRAGDRAANDKDAIARAGRRHRQERRHAEQPAVHVSGLRGHRATLARVWRVRLKGRAESSRLCYRPTRPSRA